MSQTRRRKHDEVYKFFFSQAAVVAELLEDYVARDWVGELDLSTLRKLTPERVGPELARRQADMLWRVDFRHRPGFMVLILEFQSEVDPYMAARVLRYVADTYEDLIRERRPGDPTPLPPVVACIVYNGPPPWDARTAIESLAPAVLSQLEDRTARLPYWRLDMRAPVGRTLRKRRVLTWLRELERGGGSLEHVLEVLDQVAEAYPAPEHAQIAKAFELWAVGASRLWGRSEAELSEITTLLEARKMYSAIREEIARLRQEGRREGRQEGHREGRREGRKEVAREVLTSLVARKFGTDAVEELSGALEESGERGRAGAAAEAVMDCDTVADLAARLAK